jgi:exodeoxyribonuclease VII large subunit
VLTVHELNALARGLLEDAAPDVWVEGELRDLTRPASGHLYFSLSDGRAQVRCVMFRTDAVRVRVGPVGGELAEGMRIRVRGGLTLYEARGTFQLTVRTVLAAGEGERAAEIARIKKKLAEDGLLDPTRKRALPRHPRTVGVVTSRDGAAWRDVVKVALDRFPARLVLVHATVQGEDAPMAIVRALAWVQKLRTLDVVILARGGGASEDLAAFDDERVARAVAACRVPIVTGVGHEIDVTLSDLCADVRAATPSNAAELAVPSIETVRAELVRHERELQRALDQRLDALRLRLERATRALRDPRRQLREQLGALGRSEREIERSLRRRTQDERLRLRRLSERLARLEPRARLARDRARLEAQEARLGPAMRSLLARHAQALRDAESRLERRARTTSDTARQQLARSARALHALSPLAVLDRGYAIVTLGPGGPAVRDAREAALGARLSIRIARGRLEADVVAVVGADVADERAGDAED